MRSKQDAFSVQSLRPWLAVATLYSPIGLIPKPIQPGKWWLIVDLFAPSGSSINDAIDPNLCSLRYASLDDAVHMVRELSPGSLLAKLDWTGSGMVPSLPWYMVSAPLPGRFALFGPRKRPKLCPSLTDSGGYLSRAGNGSSHKQGRGPSLATHLYGNPD